MIEIVKLLRVLQFYAHLAHNYCKGPLFFQDHTFLGDLYKTYEEDYDDLVERILGLGQQINLNEINKAAVVTIDSLPILVKENKEFFSTILSLEQKLSSSIDSICKSESLSEGTKQLIGEMANKSEKRQYLLKQRIK